MGMTTGSLSTVVVAESAVVRVYDSLYPHLTTETQQQIAAIINTPKPKVQLEFINVQNQSGSNDCGAFAIAFGTALIFGEEPGKLIFAEEELRKHLFKCLKNRKLDPFPVVKRK